MSFRDCSYEAAPGITLNCKAVGSGKRAVVLLHGFGASIATWFEILPLLTVEDMTYYLVDLKGFGDSSKPRDGTYSMEAQRNLVLALLAHLPADHITLGGHSYGGAVALLTYLEAQRSPNQALGRVDSLVFIDAPAYPQKLPFFISMLRNPFTRFLSGLMSAEQRVRFILNRIVFDKSKITTAMIARYADGLKDPNSSYALAQVARQVVPGNPDEIAARIGTIAVPTLIIWGANDRVIPLGSGERLHREIRTSSWVVMDRCGHVPQEEYPRESAAAINGFLASLRSKGADQR